MGWEGGKEGEEVILTKLKEFYLELFSINNPNLSISFYLLSPKLNSNEWTFFFKNYIIKSTRVLKLCSSFYTLKKTLLLILHILNLNFIFEIIPIFFSPSISTLIAWVIMISSMMIAQIHFFLPSILYRLVIPLILGQEQKKISPSYLHKLVVSIIREKKNNFAFKLHLDICKFQKTNCIHQVDLIPLPHAHLNQPCLLSLLPYPTTA